MDMLDEFPLDMTPVWMQELLEAVRDACCCLSENVFEVCVDLKDDEDEEGTAHHIDFGVGEIVIVRDGICREHISAVGHIDLLALQSCFDQVFEFRFERNPEILDEQIYIEGFVDGERVICIIHTTVHPDLLVEYVSTGEYSAN